VAVGGVGVALGRPLASLVNISAGSESPFSASSKVNVTLVGTSVLCPSLTFSSTADATANTALDGTSSLITVGGVGIAAASNATLTVASVEVRAATAPPAAGGPLVFVGGLSRVGGADANMTGVGGVGIACAAPLTNPARLGPSFSVAVLGTVGAATASSVNVSVGAVSAAAFSGFVGLVGIAYLAMPSPPGMTFAAASALFFINWPTTAVSTASCVLDGSRLILAVNRSLVRGADRTVATTVFGVGIAKACYLSAATSSLGYAASSLCLVDGYTFKVTAANMSQNSALNVSVDATNARDVVGAIGIATTAIYMSGQLFYPYYVTCTAVTLSSVRLSASPEVADGGETLAWTGLVGAIGIALSRIPPNATALIYPLIRVEAGSKVRVALDDLGTATTVVGAVGLILRDFARSFGAQAMLTGADIEVVGTLSASGSAVGAVGVVVASTSFADVTILLSGCHVRVHALDVRGAGAVGAVGIVSSFANDTTSPTVSVSTSTVWVGEVVAPQGHSGIVGALGVVVTSALSRFVVWAPSVSCYTSNVTILKLSATPWLSAVVGGIGIVGHGASLGVPSSMNNPPTVSVSGSTVVVHVYGAEGLMYLAAVVGGVGIAVAPPILLWGDPTAGASDLNVTKPTVQVMSRSSIFVSVVAPVVSFVGSLVAGAGIRGRQRRDVAHTFVGAVDVQHRGGPRQRQPGRIRRWRNRDRRHQREWFSMDSSGYRVSF
jgi:hypothetical protein